MTNGTGHRAAPPLYDARFEHDACGVGFVADAGGRSRDRVLPLALAGLAALGHRGAFGADGASSDGAGVSLPLDRSRSRAARGHVGRCPPGGGLLPSCRAVVRPGPRARADRTDLRRGGHAGPPLARRSVRSRISRARGRRSPTRVQPGDRGPSGGGVRYADRRRRLRTTPRRCPPARGERSTRRGWRPRRARRSRRRRAGPWSTRVSSRAPGSPSCTPTWPNRSWSATRSSTSGMRRTRIPYGASPSPSGRSPTTARSIPSAATGSRSGGAPGTAARSGSRPS